MLQLGDKVQDSVTGYAGTIVAIAEYIGGNKSYQVAKMRTDGGISEVWFDENRLELVEKEE